LICITGDIHGDLKRFSDKKIKKLKKGDMLIVCGDFGFIWDGGKKEQQILKKIGKKKFYTLFIEGCNDNLNLIAEYPTAEFCGGMVHEISGNLKHLIRGNVYDFLGQRFFVFGGGLTKDLDIRQNAGTYFESELADNAEINASLKKIAASHRKFDYIVTHEPPASIKELLSFETNQISFVHNFFEAVKKDCSFTQWFFGKAHKNKIIPPKYTCLFDGVAVIATESDGKKKGKSKNDKQPL
jgi:Icc-related predicted phosphoesterase